MHGSTRLTLLLTAALLPLANAHARDAETASDSRDGSIVVTGARTISTAGTKTDTPLIETPQPITVITDDMYLSQGSISISDALRYVSGVQALSLIHI